MTAEVAVLNSNGVALAADSAVTVGQEEGKVYTSADKLFQLSEYAPVGIMVYDSATFLGVPWETVIKCYRAEWGTRTFERLADYSKSFTSFLTRSRMFTPASQKNDVCNMLLGYFSYLRDRLIKDVEVEYQKGHKLSESEIKKMFADLAKEELEKTKKHKKLEGITPRISRLIRQRYGKDIAATRQKVFEKLPISRVSDRCLTDIVVHLLTRERLKERGQSSGIVVAGFGGKEHFPTLVKTEVFGMAAGHLLHSKREQAAITHGGQAIVVPLAQREMVYTFIWGIDPDFKSLIEKTTKDLFDQMAEIILVQVKRKYPVYGKKFLAKVRTSIDKLVPDLYNEWDSTRTKKYSEPVMRSVASLPKDELGSMAEALVNLTKFKRRISIERETVGGPIDVAVITKGDGFVWMKRKHYFEAGLNPRFMARIAKGRTS